MDLLKVSLMTMSHADSCPDETRSMNCDDDDDDEEDVQQMISWLQENQEPKEKIAEFMSKTAEKRKHFIHEEQATLCDILKEFPRILDKGMVRLFICFVLKKSISLYKDVWSVH